MRNIECEKTNNIIEPKLNDSDKIMYGLIGLSGLSALLILWPLIGTFFSKKLLLTHTYGFSLDFLYKISLGIQVMVIFVVTLFSLYILINRTWGKELWIKKADVPLNKEEQEKENKAMESCGYNYNEEKWDKAKGIANNALSEFKFYWFLIWCSWLFLYIVYLIRHCLENHGSNTKIIDFFLNPLSNANTLMLLICYLILFEITLAEEQTGISEKPNWAPWASLFLIITFAEILIRSLDPSNAASKGYIEIFNWINGITSGAVMALFVGAFDTEFIKPKFVCTLLLYLYMAVQAIFPIILNDGQLSLAIFKNDEELRIAIKLLFSITTLICKTVLFLFVFKQIKSGRLLFYFIRIRKQHYDFGNKWSEFLKLPEIAWEKGCKQKYKSGVKLKEIKVRSQ